jgi:hypothetical protein
MTHSGDIAARLRHLRPLVDRHVTRERARRYLRALADTPAPSTTAAALRGPVLRRRLREDDVFAGGRLTLDADFRATGSPAIPTRPRSFGILRISTRSATWCSHLTAYVIRWCRSAST